MTHRIAIAGINHETNTFVSTPTDLSMFLDSGFTVGRAIVERYAGSETSIAGHLAGCEGDDVVGVPLLYAVASPGGIIADPADRYLSDQLLTALRNGGPFDAVLLTLHGAAVSKRAPDFDGDLLQSVRDVVGPDTIIGVTLDMHANISASIVEPCDVITVYQANPHIDAKEAARRCADLVLGTLRRRIEPVIAWTSVPIALHIAAQDTSREPMRSFLQEARRVSEQRGILSIDIVEGFPYADVPQMGMGVIAMADRDLSLAARSANQVASHIWDRRGQTSQVLSTPEQSLAEAAADPGTVMVLDVGDNIGGGGPGDSTILLHAARALGITSVFQTICDPEAATKLADCEPGREATIMVGGRHPDSPAAPFEVRGTIRAASDGLFEDAGPTHDGDRYFDAGPSVLVGGDDGIDVLVTTNRIANTTVAQMTALGVSPADYSVVIGKGVNGPRASFGPHVVRFIEADTPGPTAAGLDLLPYLRRQQRFPFEDWEWTPDPRFRVSQ